MNTNLRTKLKHLGACQEALKWVGNKSTKTAWNTCYRESWMYWIVKRLNNLGYLSKKYADITYCAYFYGARIAKKHGSYTAAIPGSYTVIKNASRSIRIVVPAPIIIEAFRKYGLTLKNK